MKPPLPVWPYYALAIIMGVGGALLLYFNLGSDFPKKDDLQKISGPVEKVVLVDEISGEPTNADWPMSLLQFTLENVDGAFHYPRNWPGYTQVYNRLGLEVDVWVDRADIGSGGPMVVYALRQHTPENWVAEPIVVSYEEIVASRGRSGASYVRVGIYLLVGTAGWIVLARVVSGVNRRRRAVGET